MSDFKYIYRLIRIHLLRVIALSCGKRTVPKANRVLIVAPHPDDEVLGCSGIIQQYIKHEVEVSVLILTRGENSLKEDPEQIKIARTRMAEEAATLLGVSQLLWGDLTDGQICHADMIKFADLVRSVRPDILFIPHYLEGWSDHEATEYKWRELIQQVDLPVKCFHYCVWFWYSMPYSKFSKVSWSKAFVVKMSQEAYLRKCMAIDIYLSGISPVTGKPYSGELPEEFIYANQWKYELFFEAK